MGMTNVDVYDYMDQQKEELQATDKAEKTIDDVANAPIDAKTEGFFKNVGGFFDSIQRERKLFQSTREKTMNNPDLDSRVSKLEEKVKIMEQMQLGLESSITADPELSSLLNRGSVNYNPGVMGKEVFVNQGASLEAANL